MSEFTVDPETIVSAAVTITHTNPEHYASTVGAQYRIAGALDNSTLQGTVSSNMVAEYYNMILVRYAMPHRAETEAYSLYLKESATSYDLSETTNRQLADAFPDSDAIE